MVQKLFVFGTLKRGFPLHDEGLSGAKFLGAYRTQKRYPLLIAGPWFAPMMLNEPGVGYQIMGELYKVGTKALEKLDRLESVGEPGNFRATIEVEPIEGGFPCLALAYMKSREVADPVHSDHLQLYEDRRFIPFGQRH
ncbi:MAG: gamma-glutamylcyclotransferase [Rhizobiaceae bacterium]|nr:gamma-glutamylcyclotransferase [Rhizobiaceae bacterium]MCV0406639.1 gamma-glutamylcyclotransferase [Rhizobiaceae bacterium]